MLEVRSDVHVTLQVQSSDAEGSRHATASSLAALDLAFPSTFCGPRVHGPYFVDPISCRVNCNLRVQREESVLSEAQLIIARRHELAQSVQAMAPQSWPTP